MLILGASKVFAKLTLTVITKVLRYDKYETNLSQEVKPFSGLLTFFEKKE